MSTGEIREFLTHGTRTGKLAVLTPSGHPHVMPIWFVLDPPCGGQAAWDIVFNTGAKTVKGKHILSDGRVSLAVDDEQPPFAYVHIRGTATAEDNPPDMLEWATRIGARYMGEDRAEEFGRRNGVPGELLVRLTPERVIAERGVAD
ncbi:MAG TPA: PPOX class F420-dependent oxidoreductase [Thermoleophilaceae bacterium]|nr:PPOX class F420-dependent oxidoreductase [Thermoleophilaceae bacterium]